MRYEVRNEQGQVMYESDNYRMACSWSNGLLNRRNIDSWVFDTEETTGLSSDAPRSTLDS
jgi:hypothetical protein